MTFSWHYSEPVFSRTCWSVGLSWEHFWHVGNCPAWHCRSVRSFVQAGPDPSYTRKPHLAPPDSLRTVSQGSSSHFPSWTSFLLLQTISSNAWLFGFTDATFLAHPTVFPQQLSHFFSFRGPLLVFSDYLRSPFSHLHWLLAVTHHIQFDCLPL